MRARTASVTMSTAPSAICYTAAPATFALEDMGEHRQLVVGGLLVDKVRCDVLEADRVVGTLEAREEKRSARRKDSLGLL